MNKEVEDLSKYNQVNQVNLTDTYKTPIKKNEMTKKYVTDEGER